MKRKQTEAAKFEAIEGNFSQKFVWQIVTNYTIQCNFHSFKKGENFVQLAKRLTQTLNTKNPQWDYHLREKSTRSTLLHYENQTICLKGSDVSARSNLFITRFILRWGHTQHKPWETIRHWWTFSPLFSPERCDLPPRKQHQMSGKGWWLSWKRQASLHIRWNFSQVRFEGCSWFDWCSWNLLQSSFCCVFYALMFRSQSKHSKMFLFRYFHSIIWHMRKWYLPHKNI